MVKICVKQIKSGGENQPLWLQKLTKSTGHNLTSQKETNLSSRLRAPCKSEKHDYPSTTAQSSYLFRLDKNRKTQSAVSSSLFIKQKSQFLHDGPCSLQEKKAAYICFIQSKFTRFSEQYIKK